MVTDPPRDNFTLFSKFTHLPNPLTPSQKPRLTKINQDQPKLTNIN